MSLLKDFLSLKPDQLFFSQVEKDRMVEVVFKRPISALLKTPAIDAIGTFAKLLPHYHKIPYHIKDRELWTKIKMELPNRRVEEAFRDIAFIHLIEKYLIYQIADIFVHPSELIKKPTKVFLKGAHIAILLGLVGLTRHIKGI